MRKFTMQGILNQLSGRVNCADFIRYNDPWYESYAKRSNFCVKINGDVYSFVYARKFACTTLKKLVRELYGDIEFFEHTKQNLYHNCSEDVRARVFFYRDPLERVVSCFFNKFIEKTGLKYSPHAYNQSAIGGMIKGVDEHQLPSHCAELASDSSQ